MLSDILPWIIGGYSALMISFFLGAFFSRFRGSGGGEPRVSVIVAARNEEDRIGACLESLLSLRYPRNLLEIIIVDDRSTDATATIVRQHAAHNPHLRLVSSGPESGHVKGKTNAVACGVEASSGEILVFTDADCLVPAGWVDEVLSHFSDEDVGVVAGFTSLWGNSWFDRIQAFDWFLLFSAAAATARLGYPTTAVGTNLSVRRTAYEATGGYRKIPFSVTEDYALFNAVLEAGYKAKFPMTREMLVESGPCTSWRQLYRQKKRWFMGGRGMKVKSLLIFAIPYLLLIGLPLTALFSPSPLVWWGVLIKAAADLLFALPALVRFRRTDLLVVFPLFEVYYSLYVLIFPLIVLPGQKIVWKERKL
jgi:1,2-diacylglycerol 3-beta-glucosyltransferase